MMSDIKTREGMEFWDKICSLKHYGFIHSPDNSRVLKAEGIGNWIDKYEAQEIVDQAQDRINELKAELVSVKENGRHWHESSNKAIDAMTLVANQRDALQLRLNAADQRIDELTAKPSDAERKRLMEIVERYPNGDPLQYNAAMKEVSKMIGIERMPQWSTTSHDREN